MFVRDKLWVIFLTGLILVVGCSRTPLRTSAESTIQPKSIRSLAIFPVRNERLIPHESRELNLSVLQMFQQKNPNLKIVGPTESITLINRAGLADKYGKFLGDYARSRVPNANTLRAMGEILHVDAILQGEVCNIEQTDGDYKSNLGSTFLTIRYSLMGTNDGIILWEVVSNATKSTATPFESAPPLREAILIAQDWILTSLPELGK
jgi:hypothetical protein